MSNLKWTISYIYNGENVTEKHEFRTIAEMRMIQLEAYGMRPTLHENNLTLITKEKSNVQEV